MRRVVTLVFVVALCAALSGCGSSTPKSSGAVRASIVAAALAQKSVHYVENDEIDMQGSSTLTAAVTADSGKALFESSDGTVEMRLVDNTVYLRGDLSVLGLYLPRAKRYAGRWISIPRADERDARTALWFLTLAPTVKLVPRDVGLGTVANRLPGHFDGVDHDDGDTIVIDGSFSKWNEPVNVQAPANSTPIAVVRGDPKGVLASIVSAALAQKSVRMTASVSEDLIGTTSYTVDVSRDAVSERIKRDGSTMQVLVFDHAVYLRGDARILEERLNLTRAQATHYASKWIWIPDTGEGGAFYSALTDGLTLASIVRRAARMEDLKLSPGTKVLVVRGKPAVPSLPVNELRARANGTPLPVAFSGWEPGVSTSGRFSRWNEPVEIRLPETSTPIAIVRGG